MYSVRLNLISYFVSCKSKASFRGVGDSWRHERTAGHVREGGSSVSLRDFAHNLHSEISIVTMSHVDSALAR